jgi:hypothetical protein
MRIAILKNVRPAGRAFREMISRMQLRLKIKL